VFHHQREAAIRSGRERNRQPESRFHRTHTFGLENSLSSTPHVTLHGCGRSAPGFIDSDVRVYGTEGLIRTCVWGKRLEMARGGEKELTPVPVPESLGTWQQFLAVRDGRLENPCPPEIGLRMARLWDAIRASAAQGGCPVTVGACS